MQRYRAATVSDYRKMLLGAHSAPFQSASAFSQWQTLSWEKHEPTFPIQSNLILSYRVGVVKQGSIARQQNLTQMFVNSAIRSEDMTAD